MEVFGRVFNLLTASRLKTPLLLLLGGLLTQQAIASSVKLGLAHPTTGRYQQQGFDMAQGALLAIEEINAQGGILGQPVELLTENTAGKVETGVAATNSLIKQGADVVFGAASSDVAIAAGKEAARHDKLFFAALSYANETTGSAGHRHMFREPASAWMTAKALSFYLNQQLQDRRVFFLTADYSWGHSMEESIRRFTNTGDVQTHPAAQVPYPRPRHAEIENALIQADESGADVLMLIQFGDDMVTALEMATEMGLKERMEIIVPSLTQNMAANAGASLMEGIVGTVPWTWQVSFEFGYQRGQDFVNAYVEKYDQYPDSPAASAYSIVYQIKEAAENARGINSNDLIDALEGHKYSLLKEPQQWRAFDHQNIQSVYVVRCKSWDDVMKSPLRSDYFEVMLSLPGSVSARTEDEWKTDRMEAGQLTRL